MKELFEFKDLLRKEKTDNLIQIEEDSGLPSNELFANPTTQMEAICEKSTKIEINRVN